MSFSCSTLMSLFTSLLGSSLSSQTTKAVSMNCATKSPQTKTIFTDTWQGQTLTYTVVLSNQCACGHLQVSSMVSRASCPHHTHRLILSIVFTIGESSSAIKNFHGVLVKPNVCTGLVGYHILQSRS